MPLSKNRVKSISTALYTPNPENPGHDKFVRFFSYRELCQQIEGFLLAFGEAEWINNCQMSNVMIDGYSFDTLCEGGRITVSVRHGGSEGLILDVNHMSPKGNASNYHSLVSAKYLIDNDEVWDIAKKLSYAIHLG
jgi:hypothetical protein